jgi:hypothetical protein
LPPVGILVVVDDDIGQKNQLPSAVNTHDDGAEDFEYYTKKQPHDERYDFPQETTSLLFCLSNDRSPEARWGAVRDEDGSPVNGDAELDAR